MFTNESVKPALTRDYVLSRVSPEQIFEKYLGYPVRIGEKFVNPLRMDDTRPGCNYHYTNFGKLIFRDHAWRSFDCFDVLQIGYGLNYDQALKQIAADFGIWGIAGNKPVPKKYDDRQISAYQDEVYLPIQIKRKDFNERELGFWSVPELTVSQKDLQDRKIFSVSDVWFNGQLKLSNMQGTFGYLIGKDKYDKWQIYSPWGPKEYRFRASFTGRLVDAEFLRKDDHVVLTKSKKDAFYLSMAGINACCVLSEHKILTETELQTVLSASKNFVLFFDNDKTGMARSEEHSALYNCPYILIPNDLFFPKGRPVKDFSDLCHLWGFRAATQWIHDVLGI